LKRFTQIRAAILMECLEAQRCRMNCAR